MSPYRQFGTPEVFIPVSDEDVPPQKWRKNVIFEVNSYDLVHSFCLRCLYKLRLPLSIKMRGERTLHLKPPKFYMF